MAEELGTEWRLGGGRGVESRYEGRQELITRAARACFGRRGVAKTSIADITREVSITRELFYYYFANKGVVVDAVMDTYAEDARALMAACLSEVRQPGPLPTATALMRALRTWLATDGAAAWPMAELLRETGRWPLMACRVANEGVTLLRRGGLVAEGTARLLGMVLVGAMTELLFDAGLDDGRLAQEVARLLV